MFLTNNIKALLAALMGAVLFFLAGCSGSAPTAQDEVNKEKINAYERALKNQPADFMDYSPTRQTIIEWAKYWEKPGRLAYTYITDGPNDPAGGYYVFVGPPVSNCVGLTAPEQRKSLDLGEYDGEGFVDAPGIDHVYGGGDCSIFYGVDAVTKLPVTFSVGMGQNMTYFGQPNMRYEAAKPLGVATVEKAKR